MMFPPQPYVQPAQPPPYYYPTNYGYPGLGQSSQPFGQPSFAPFNNYSPFESTKNYRQNTRQQPQHAFALVHQEEQHTQQEQQQQQQQEPMQEQYTQQHGDNLN